MSRTSYRAAPPRGDGRHCTRPRKAGQPPLVTLGRLLPFRGEATAEDARMLGIGGATRAARHAGRGPACGPDAPVLGVPRQAVDEARSIRNGWLPGTQLAIDDLWSARRPVRWRRPPALLEWFGSDGSGDQQ